MSSAGDRRLSRLYPTLTAKERAVLVLEAHHAGHREDPQVMSTMPYEQAKEFGRLVGLMNAVNVELAMSLVLLRAQLRETEVKLAWLMTVWLMAMEQGALIEYITRHTKEPITESAFKERAAELGKDLASIDDIVLVLADRDPDAQTDDEAWERGWEAARARVEEAIASGALPAKGKGRRTRVRWSDVDAWAGLEPTACPEWGYAYEVFPDAEAARVERLRQEREFVQRVVATMGERLSYDLDEGAEPRFEPNPESSRLSIPLALIEAIPRDLAARWSELRAIEVGIERLAEEEFNGVNPLDPPGREILADCRAIVDVVVKEMKNVHVDIKLLTDPDPDDVELVGRLVRKAAEG